MGGKKSKVLFSLLERDALVFLAGTLDAIFELAPIVRELLGYFVGSARHVAVYDGSKAYDLTEVEFM